MEYENPVVFTAENTQECPACHAYFTKAAKYCPHCGMILSRAEEPAPAVQEAAAAPSAPKDGYIVRTANSQKIMLNARDTLIVGSARYDCDYCIANQLISRRHCEFIRREQNYYIKDLNSSNHTFVNGEQLVPHTEKLLKDKDVIMIAEEQFTFGLQ